MPGIFELQDLTGTQGDQGQRVDVAYKGTPLNWKQYKTYKRNECCDEEARGVQHC